MEEGLALSIKQWVTAHYHRHQPADAVRALLDLLQGQEEEEVGRFLLGTDSGVEKEGRGVAEEWRPTVEQLFWWTFASQGPHAALAFLDGAEAVTEALAPAVFVMAASSLLGHGGPLLSAAAAPMAEKCELVLARASRALELASDPSASSTTTMANVAGLLLRSGDLLLEARHDEIGTYPTSPPRLADVALPITHVVRVCVSCIRGT